MELTSDYPVWGILNGVPVSYPGLDHDLKCDVVVVGGGITGALVAYHLVEAGIETILVDKRDIGTGSTSASTGLLQYEVDVPLRTLVEKIGKRKAVRSYQLCGEAVIKLGKLIHRLKLRCGHASRPSLLTARDEKEIPDLEEEFRLRREMGLDLQFWARTDIEKHFPFSRPAALFSELAGEVDPHKLTHGLLAAAVKRGLRIYDRTSVSKFTPTRTGIDLTLNNSRTIRARRAVMACGFESMPYVKGEAGKLKSTYALISEPVEHLQEWHRRSLIWETGIPYLYARTTTDNRVIVGGEDVEVINPWMRDKLLPHKRDVLMRKFKELFPDIKLEVGYYWAGTFGETKDGIAYIGTNPGMKHAYFALGYGGNGITYSLIAAEIIRDSIMGKKNADAALFRFGR